jgi:hypothetical protein
LTSCEKLAALLGKPGVAKYRYEKQPNSTSIGSWKLEGLSLSFEQTQSEGGRRIRLTPGPEELQTSELSPKAKQLTKPDATRSILLSILQKKNVNLQSGK